MATGAVPPANGSAITVEGGTWSIPAVPIIPFVEGDGTGRDIWKAARRVLDAAVSKAYGGAKGIAMMTASARAEPAS